MNIYTQLEKFNITLPPVAIPAAAYVPFVQTGNLVFISGHIAKKDGQVWVGQLGNTMQTAEGKLAARAIAVDLMGTLHAAVGDLNRVKRIVKLMSLVNSTGSFTEHHLVTNGASELIGEVFGEGGACGHQRRCARRRAHRTLLRSHRRRHCGAQVRAHHGGERGAHARSAFGVAQIPLGACVEIEMIAELAD